MVCFRYIIVNTVHKGDYKDDDNDNDNNNNNNNNLTAILRAEISSLTNITMRYQEI